MVVESHIIIESKYLKIKIKAKDIRKGKNWNIGENSIRVIE